MRRLMGVGLVAMLCCIVSLFGYLLSNPELLGEAIIQPSVEGASNHTTNTIGDGEKIKEESELESIKEQIVEKLPIQIDDAERVSTEDYDQKRIVMYYPEWGIYGGHNNWMPKDIPWQHITHMNYAFFTIQGESPTLGNPEPNHSVKLFDRYAALEADAGGNEAWDSPYRGVIGAMQRAKSAYPQVKMMMSIGGWSQSANFVEASATEEARQIFVESAINLMRQYNFDGIDIDWEYPTFKREPDKTDNPNDQGNPRASTADTKQFTLLLEALRKGLDKASENDNKHYELSVAVGAGIDKMQQTDIKSYMQYTDFINLMTYDFHGAWEAVTGHQSQLYSRKDATNPYDHMITQYSVHDAVQYMLIQGVPSQKIVIGIPYYYVVEILECDSSFTKYWDPIAQVPYLYSESKKEFYTYDDPQSIACKMEYIKQYNLGGTIIWEATCERQGNPSLTAQIYESLK